MCAPQLEIGHYCISPRVSLLALRRFASPTVLTGSVPPDRMVLGKRKKPNGRFGNRKSKYAKRQRVSEAQIMAVVNRRTGGFVGIENKFLDTELTSTALTTSWAMLNPTGTGCTDSLSVPAEGDGQSARDGRKYAITKIYVHGVISCPSAESATSTPNDFRTRVVIYIDGQTNQAEANPVLVMDTGGSDDVLAFRQLENVARFKVLFDKTIVVRFGSVGNEGAANLFANGIKWIPFNYYHTFKEPLVVLANATTANVTSITDNNIGIMAICSATQLAPTIAYQCRIRFRG